MDVEGNETSCVQCADDGLVKASDVNDAGFTIYRFSKALPKIVLKDQVPATRCHLHVRALLWLCRSHRTCDLGRHSFQSRWAVVNWRLNGFIKTFCTKDVAARSKDASQIKFSRCLGDEKLQNKYLKKTIFQKSWVAERCKTKKTSRKPKKNNFPEVLEMEEVRQETQNIVFLFFLVFLRVFWLFSKGPSPKSLRILMLLAYPPLDFVFLWVTLPSLYTSFTIIFVS